MAPWLCLGIALTLAFVVGLAVLATQQSHEVQRERAFVVTQNLARVIEQYVTALFEKTDVALQALVFQVEQHGKAIDAGLPRELLAYQQTLLAQLDTLRYADASGRVLAGLASEGEAAISVAARDYFIRLRDDSSAQLVTSGPLKGRLSGEWMIVLARRVNGPNGEFAGVVSASIRSAQLQRLFAEIDLGAKSAIALRTEDLRIVSGTLVPGGRAAEERIAVDRGSNALREAIRMNPVAGSMTAVLPYDGVERVTSYRKLPAYPYYVVAGVATASYRAAAADVWRIWQLAAIATVLTLTIGYLILWSWQRQSQAAEAVTREGHRHQMLLRTVSDGICVVDEEGKVREVNDAFCRMLGYERDEILKMHPADWNANGSDETPRQLLAGSSPSPRAMLFESRYRHRDGSVLDVEINAITIDFDGSKMLCASVRDIGWRKQAEVALRESERQLRRVFEGSSQGFWELDLRTLSYTVSPRSQTMLGYAPGELDVSYDTLSAYVEPGDLARALESIERHVAGASERHELELRVRDKSGAWRWILTSGRIVERDAEGRPLLIAGTHTDITERKRSEAALIEAMAEAAQANQAKSRFLAAASHDLRQPLAALSLYLGALRPLMAAENRELMVNIEECVDSLSALLTDLLEVNKLDAGVIVPAPRDFALGEFLAPLVTMYAAEAELKALQLRVRLAPIVVHSDPLLLRRIVGNLIANAVRYTSRGGILIACRRRQGKRWLEVWDTGIGIAPDQRQIIFEAFTQLGDDARNQGSGLGLAIVDKMAKLLGLELRLSSRPGAGSMFAIELPEGAAPAAGPARALVLAPSLAPLRIAVVEDHPEVLQALELVLESAGHDVAAAASGRHLIAKLGKRKPDIVIADYRLAGGETGFDVIEAVREIFGDELPALLITGDTDPALIRSMADRGIAVRYKPLQFDALLSFIGETIDWRRQN